MTLYLSHYNAFTMKKFFPEMIFNHRLFLYLTLISVCIFFHSCKNDPKGNEVSVGLAGEPDGLNPITSAGQAYSRQVCERHIFCSLGDTDPNTLAFTPFLSKADAEITPIDMGNLKGGTSYTYEILEEAKWDNGEPVTGYDFEFTIKTILNPKVNAAVWRGYLDFIKVVRVDNQNPRKITIMTDKKYILAKDAIENMPILPEYIYDNEKVMRKYSIDMFQDKSKMEELANDAALSAFAKQFNNNFNRDKDKIVGCGPYQLEQWENGQRIVLKKKQNWWGNALMSSRPALAAYPDRLIYRFYGNMQTQLADLKAQNLDVMSTIPAADFKKLQADPEFSKQYGLFVQPSYTYSYLSLNTRNPILEDVNTRKALAFAIDVDGIISNILEGMAVRMNSIVLPVKEYNRKDLQPIPFDIQKAKIMLAEAGWKDSDNNGILDKKINGKNTELKLNFLIPNKAPLPELALLVQNSVKEAGIRLNPVAKDFNVIKEDIKNKNFEIAYTAKGGNPSLDDFEQSWHSTKGSNDTGFGNPAMDELIEQMNSTLDAGARNQLYGKFQQLIYDGQPVILLTNAKERIAISKRFPNAHPSLLRPYFFEQSFQK